MKKCWNKIYGGWDSKADILLQKHKMYVVIPRMTHIILQINREVDITAYHEWFPPTIRQNIYKLKGYYNVLI